MALPTPHQALIDPTPSGKRWRALALVLAAVLGLAGGAAWARHGVDSFNTAVRGLKARWATLARDGVPTASLAPLEARLTRVARDHVGPIPVVWLGPPVTHQSLHNLILATVATRVRAFRTARLAALRAGRRWAEASVRWHPDVLGSVTRAIERSRTPTAWNRLAAAYVQDRASLEANLQALSAASGGQVQGEPLDVVAAEGQLQSLEMQLYPGSSTAGAVRTALTAAGKYLALSPSRELASHHVVMTSLAGAIAAARQGAVLAFPASITAYLGGRLGTVSLALYDAKTGTTYVYNPTARFDTASIVKVTIMAALLYRSEEDHTPPGVSEQAVMAPMIEASVNQDATILFNDLGGAPGLGPILAAAGMSQTTPDAAWGLTETTALDQVRLLKLIAYPNGVLDPASTAYAENLMENVVSYERWGVSVGLPADVTVALKNGWLPIRGGWVINSIGHVAGDGQDYVLAMLSDGNPSEGYGIDTLSTVSGLIWHMLS
ncbi:MAG: serine hydrolase [Clostridia bacterium]